MVSFASMNVSVIIVTMNAKEYLRRCLDSIKQYSHDIEYEVIVVDNGSTDGTQELLQHEYEHVHSICNNTNLGFGRANNLGAEISTGEVLLFLNDDTEFQENSLKIAYEKMMSENDIGVLGAHLVFPNTSHQDSVRAYPSLVDQLIVLTKIHNFFPSLPAIQRYMCSGFDYKKENDVDQVMGACMFIRKEVFELANGFDERFFVWFEEVDLQRRILKEQRLRIMYSPITEIVHVKGATFSKILSVTNQRRLNRSMRQYFFKHHGVFQGVVISLFQPCSLVLAFIVQVMKKVSDISKYKDEQQ